MASSQQGDAAASPRRASPSASRSAHQRILAAKKEGQWQDTLSIIAEMRAAGHSLGTVSYNAAIDACGKAKQVNRALELFDDLVAAGNVPDAVTYTALIDACGRASHLDQAFTLFARCALPAKFKHDSQLFRAAAPAPVGAHQRRPPLLAPRSLPSSRPPPRPLCLSPARQR